MYTNFNEYYAARQEAAMTEQFVRFAQLAIEHNVDEAELLTEVFAPVLVEGEYGTSKQLLNEFLKKLISKLTGKGGSAPIELGDEHEDLTPIADKPSYGSYRPKADRQQSWGDIKDRDRATAADNVEKDARNQGREKRALINQAGAGLVAKKKEFFDFAGQAKQLVLNAIKGTGLVQSLKADPVKTDVMTQFMQFLDKVMDQFKPNFSPARYHQDADLSGVKSGLGDQHGMPAGKKFYPGADGGDGYGVYPTNQHFGDDERSKGASNAADFKAKARQLRAK